MSYCSIEEAWGDNFSKSTKPKKKKKRVILEGDDYSRVTLPRKSRSKVPKQYRHSDIYDTHNYYNENSNINTIVIKTFLSCQMLQVSGYCCVCRFYLCWVQIIKTTLFYCFAFFY